MITVNLGEIHHGEPMRGEPRGWRMIYLRPAILARMAGEDEAHPFEFAHSSFLDETVTRMFVRLFAVLTAEPADRFAVDERLAILIDRLIGEHGARAGGGRRRSQSRGRLSASTTSRRRTSRSPNLPQLLGRANSSCCGPFPDVSA